MSTQDVLTAILPYDTHQVLITGGEPLLQRNTSSLVKALTDQNYAVSIETHGEISIEKVANLARIIMDIKTPASGMSRGGFVQNLKFLKPTDEIKFVIASKDDYLWAKQWVLSGQLPKCEILFSPVVTPVVTKGEKALTPTWLAEQILEDKLSVRFQLQLHKLLWGNDKRGV